RRSGRPADRPRRRLRCLFQAGGAAARRLSDRRLSGGSAKEQERSLARDRHPARRRLGGPPDRRGRCPLAPRRPAARAVPVGFELRPLRLGARPGHFPRHVVGDRGRRAARPALARRPSPHRLAPPTDATVRRRRHGAAPLLRLGLLRVELRAPLLRSVELRAAGVPPPAGGHRGRGPGDGARTYSALVLAAGLASVLDSLGLALSVDLSADFSPLSPLFSPFSPLSPLFSPFSPPSPDLLSGAPFLLP